MLLGAANGLSLTANQFEETILWWLPRLLVVTQCAWVLVGRRWADGPNGCPWCLLRTRRAVQPLAFSGQCWSRGRFTMWGWRTEIWSWGCSLDSWQDYWCPYSLYYPYQHSATWGSNKGTVRGWDGGNLMVCTWTSGSEIRKYVFCLCWKIHG